MDTKLEHVVKALVSDMEVEAAAAALAFSLGRLWGAAKHSDRDDLRAHARAALYAAAGVRLYREEHG